MLLAVLLLAMALAMIERAQRRRLAGLGRWSGWATGSLSLIVASAAGGWAGLMMWIGMIPVIAGAILLRRSFGPRARR